MTDIATAIKRLRTIPCVGPSLAEDLVDLGYNDVDQLARQNPEQMYEALCQLRNTHIDRCVLYVFRCAVYYASHTEYDTELLKWWNWKDDKISQRDSVEINYTPKG